MKLFIKIFLFVLAALIADLKVVSASISFINIQEVTTFYSFHRELSEIDSKVIENYLENCCPNGNDLVDYRDWVISIETVAAKGGGNAIKAEGYTITKTVANNLATRPYINSPSTIRNIMKLGKGVPDAHFKGGVNYKVPGEFNGSSGIFELGINPQTKTIYHFLFKTVN